MVKNIIPQEPIDLDKVAILLDIDGTILEFAPTPREVRVPPTLRQTLQGLFERTGGALALVSGRSICCSRPFSFPRSADTAPSCAGFPGRRTIRTARRRSIPS